MRRSRGCVIAHGSVQELSFREPTRCDWEMEEVEEAALLPVAPTLRSASSIALSSTGSSADPIFWPYAVTATSVGGAVLLSVALAYGLIATRTRRKNRDKNRSLIAKERPRHAERETGLVITFRFVPSKAGLIYEAIGLVGDQLLCVADLANR